MSGIHIDKSVATWRGNDGVINLIFPQRCDTAIPKFKLKVDNADDDANAWGQSSGSQYDSSNTAVTTLDTTNCVSANNIILFMNRIGLMGMNFDRNNMFPVLYQTKMQETTPEVKDNTGKVTTPASTTISNFVRPIFFAMFPKVYYDEHSDKVTLTYWNNVRTHTGGVLEKFTYKQFYDKIAKTYEIYNVVSTDNTTVETGVGQRAMFVCEGTRLTRNFNINITFAGKSSNPAPTSPSGSSSPYFEREIYIFSQPRIVFVPPDSSVEPVVDIGAGGGSLTDHLHLRTGDGGTSFSTLYPSTDAEATDSGLVHIIPAALLSGLGSRI